MKVALYSPYLSTGHMGGGEKQLLDFALVAAEGNNVSLAVSSTSNDQSFAKQQKELRSRIEDFLGKSISDITIIQTPLGTDASPIQKLLWTRQFDYLYSVTDGSLFFSLAKRNNLHIQIPFTNSQNRVLNRIKLMNWQIKNANSIFTKSIVEKHWRTDIQYVHYPKVDYKKLQSDNLAEKEMIILSVGRFFRQLHSKRQDIVITAFRQFMEKYPKLSNKWRLVCIGSIEDKSYVDEVKKSAEGLPVEFYFSLNREQLEGWYKRSRFFWHAAGFGLNENEQPERVEHFGISVIEAMAAGAIPLVVGAGGPKEILRGDLQILQWRTIAECVEKTAAFIQNATQERKMRQLAELRAQDFGNDRFRTTALEMLSV